MKKQVAQLAKSPVNSEADYPVSLENVGLDAPNVIRKTGRQIKSLSQWTKNEPKEK